VPTEAAGSFHHQALAAGCGEHALAVGSALFFEQFHAGHRHHADVLAFSAQLGGCFHAEIELGSGADQDQVRGAIAVPNDVTTLVNVVGVGVGLVGHRLAAEEHHGGAVAVGHGHPVSTGGFVAVAGAHHHHVRD